MNQKERQVGFINSDDDGKNQSNILEECLKKLLKYDLRK